MTTNGQFINYTAMQYRYIIGIDPGTKTGLAVWDCEKKKFKNIDSMKIHEAMTEVMYWHKYAIVLPILVRFEDARLRKWYGLNIVTFNKWLKYWKENNHYNYVIKNQPKQRKLEQHNEPTEAEIEQILLNGVNRCYNHWLNYKKEIIDYGNPVYDFLVQKGYIKHTELEWQNYMLKAEIEVVKAYREQAVSIDRIERQGAKRVLKYMEIGGEVESLAKRLALSDYFEIVKKAQ